MRLDPLERDGQPVYSNFRPAALTRTMDINSGLHHVTAVCRDPRRNRAFYTQVLGLRFVKRTVNFDDPHTWHLYYGDETGSPGTALTFFPWADLPVGRGGAGLAQETSYTIPESALSFWLDRLTDHGVSFDPPKDRFGERVVTFRDPDGMELALVARPDTGAKRGWGGGPVSAEHAIIGFDGVSLWMGNTAPSAAVLQDVLGFRLMGTEGERTRWQAPGPGPGRRVDLRSMPGLIRGRLGAGSVHHVAFRAADDTAQAAMQARLSGDLGIGTSEQRNRIYFRSIYFREPSGVLFEIATDQPGFTVDETTAALGTSLRLPPWYEERREEIVARLPPLD
jgi:glyoxalase family protein